MYDIRQVSQSIKGFGAFSNKEIHSGDVVLVESPLLLYPQASLVREVCSFCLKDLGGNPDVSQCGTCPNAYFCNEACKNAASIDPGSHSPLVCLIMSRVCVARATDETASALHLLSRLYGLLFASVLGNDKSARERIDSFQSLSQGNLDVVLQDGDYVAWLDDVYQRMLPVFESPDLDFNALQSLNATSADFVRSISLKDLVNAYGIRAPRRFSTDCSLIRGSALYKDASRINHECLPNLARCDEFDSNDRENTFMIFKALHDLPSGAELTQSYFPLGWDFEERQTRCSSVYGFTCSCPRCVTESQGTILDKNKDIVDEGYISVFLLKYLCVDGACEGTMIPVQDCVEKTLVCNVCSKTRNEAQFLAILENVQ